MEHVESTLSHELEIDWFSLLPQYAVAGVTFNEQLLSTDSEKLLETVRWSGLSLWPPLPLIMENRFSTQS